MDNELLCNLQSGKTKKKKQQSVVILPSIRPQKRQQSVVILPSIQQQKNQKSVTLLLSRRWSRLGPPPPNKHTQSFIIHCYSQPLVQGYGNMKYQSDTNSGCSKFVNIFQKKLAMSESVLKSSRKTENLVTFLKLCSCRTLLGVCLCT